MTAMILEILIGLIFISFFLGFYLREVLDTLHNILERLESLKNGQKEEIKPAMGMAEPMTRQEVLALMEKERIELLNK